MRYQDDLPCHLATKPPCTRGATARKQAVRKNTVNVLLQDTNVMSIVNVLIVLTADIYINFKYLLSNMHIHFNSHMFHRIIYDYYLRFFIFLVESFFSIFPHTFFGTPSGNHQKKGGLFYGRTCELFPLPLVRTFGFPTHHIFSSSNRKSFFLLGYRKLCALLLLHLLLIAFLSRDKYFDQDIQLTFAC